MWLTHASQHIYCIYCTQCNVAMPGLLRKYSFSLRWKSSVAVGSKWGKLPVDWLLVLPCYVILFTCHMKLEFELDPVSSKMTLHRLTWVRKTKRVGLSLSERQKLLNLEWSMVLYRLLPVRKHNDFFCPLPAVVWPIWEEIWVWHWIYFFPEVFAVIMCKRFAFAQENKFCKIFVKSYMKNTTLQVTEVFLDHQMYVARSFMLF